MSCLLSLRRFRMSSLKVSLFFSRIPLTSYKTCPNKQVLCDKSIRSHATHPVFWNRAILLCFSPPQRNVWFQTDGQRVWVWHNMDLSAENGKIYKKGLLLCHFSIFHIWNLKAWLSHRVSAVQFLQQSEIGAFRKSTLLIHQRQQAQFLIETRCYCISTTFLTLV